METAENIKAAGETTQENLNIKGKIIEYAWWMKKEGYSEATILGRSKLLKIMANRGANLYDPETIKNVIAKHQWSNGWKNNAADAYSSFLKMVGGKWKRHYINAYANYLSFQKKPKSTNS